MFSATGNSLILYCLAIVGLLCGCDAATPNYFPLDAGHYWQYTIERTTMDGTVTQKHILKTLPSRQWDGTNVGVKQSVAGHEYYYRIDRTGVSRVAYKPRGSAESHKDTPQIQVIPADPRIGNRWRQRSETIVLENTGPPWETLFRITEPLDLEYVVESTTEIVEVPAGRFHDCLKIVGRGQISADVGNYIGRAAITVEVSNWYAPKVGLVRMQRLETTDAKALNFGSLDMELESF